MSYKREDIQSMIAESKRVKDLISVQKPVEKPPVTFMDVLEHYVDQRIAGLIEEMKPKDGVDGAKGKDAITPVKGKDYFTPQEIKSIKDYIDSNIPQKGVHYFDGENGYTPIKGKDYFDGQDGTNVSPEDAKMMMSELLKEMSVKDIGGITQEDVNDLLDSREKIGNKKLEKRLLAVQGSSSLKKRLDELTDTVMRNYGGHGGSGGSGSATNRDIFTATNNQTVFTASMTVKSDIQVSESGTILTPLVDYTDTTTTLTLTVGVPAGTVVIWYYNIA